MAEQIMIDAATFARATDLARATLSVYEQRKGYYNNTTNSHLRGKVGEFACALWLKTLGVTADHAFEEPTRASEADLKVVVGGRQLGIDVKTWDERFWPSMGRCVAVGQLDALAAKAEVIIWCVTPSVLESGVEVQIVGWSRIEDVRSAPKRETGPAHGRKVLNYQLEPSRLRALAELTALVAP